MITIFINDKAIDINLNLLKSRLKKAVAALLKVLVIAFGFCGVFWILGTEGASKTTDISFYQIIKQVIQGGFFCGIAYVLNFIKNALQ